MLSTSNRLEDLTMEEDVGGNVCGVYVFQPAAQARHNFPHACQEHMAVDRVVGIPLVIGKANPVKVVAVMVLPLAVKVRHNFSPGSDTNCQLVRQQVFTEGRKLGAKEHLPDQPAERFAGTERPHVSPTSFGNFVKRCALGPAKVRLVPRHRPRDSPRQ